MELHEAQHHPAVLFVYDSITNLEPYTFHLSGAVHLYVSKDGKQLQLILTSKKCAAHPNITAFLDVKRGSQNGFRNHAPPHHHHPHINEQVEKDKHIKSKASREPMG